MTVPVLDKRMRFYVHGLGRVINARTSVDDFNREEISFEFGWYAEEAHNVFSQPMPRETRTFIVGTEPFIGFVWDGMLSIELGPGMWACVRFSHTWSIEYADRSSRLSGHKTHDGFWLLFIFFWTSDLSMFLFTLDIHLRRILISGEIPSMESMQCRTRAEVVSKGSARWFVSIWNTFNSKSNLLTSWPTEI